MVYVDDLLCIDLDPKKHIDAIGSVFKMKDGSTGQPKVYLGSNCLKVEFRSGGECWAMSAEQYVTDTVKTVKQRLKDDGYEFNKKLSDTKYSPKQPFTCAKYRLELEVSEMCSDAKANFYQNLIGILRWIIELGRIDINFEVANLSQYLASPRVGHLHQALHVFKYLDIHKQNTLSFDPTYLEMSEPVDGTQSRSYKQDAMKKFYPDAEELLPTNAPKAGKAVQTNVFCDTDHAGNKITRRSQSGILIFLKLPRSFGFKETELSRDKYLFKRVRRFENNG